MTQRRQPADREAAAEGRLLAQHETVTTTAPAGLHQLGLDGARDALLYVPSGYRPEQPAPLALMFHGAGGVAQHGLALLQGFAEMTGIIVLAPPSRRQTWDVIYGSYGPDITFIDRALMHTLKQYAIDPSRVAVGGFSDGASYALSVGITNGELFSHVLAFSPGFMVPADQRGRPSIYISHGTHDDVLPIERCSRRIAPQLQKAGYDVVYREFDGPHTVPADIASEAAAWFSPPV